MEFWSLDEFSEHILTVFCVIYQPKSLKFAKRAESAGKDIFLILDILDAFSEHFLTVFCDLTFVAKKFKNLHNGRVWWERIFEFWSF